MTKEMSWIFDRYCLHGARDGTFEPKTELGWGLRIRRLVFRESSSKTVAPIRSVDCAMICGCENKRLAAAMQFAIIKG